MVTVQSAGIISIFWPIASNSNLIEYKLYSELSSKTTLFGSKFIICLESSEPILPPAPVINIFLEWIFCLSKSFFGSTLDLPRISTTSTFLILSIDTFPSIIFSKDGKTLTSIGKDASLVSNLFLF